MPKLRLDLETLSVESFAPAAAAPARGTVAAHQEEGVASSYVTYNCYSGSGSGSGSGSVLDPYAYALASSCVPQTQTCPPSGGSGSGSGSGDPFVQEPYQI